MSLPTPLTVNYGTDAYTIEFELAMTNADDSQFVIGQTTNSSLTSIYMTQYSRFQISNGGSTVFFSNGGYGLFDGSFHKYRIEHDTGGALRFYRDNVLFQTASYTASTPTATPLNALFRGGSTTSTALFNVKYIEVTGFGAGSAKWDANLSGGTGAVLPTVSGTNDATQSGTWPADNAEWVFYSSGGNTTSTITYDIGAIGFASSASIGVSVNASYDIGGITFAASSTVSAPATTATISYDIGSVSFATSATIGVRNTTAFDIGSIDYSISASATSNNSSVIAFDIGEINFDLSALVVSNISTVISYDIGAVDFAVYSTIPTNEPERSLMTKDNVFWRNSIFFKSGRI
jgi:hypothetical protein